MTWSDEDAAEENDGYEIRRNGAWVGDVEAGVMRFVDETAIPGKNLTYKIRTQSVDGRYSEPVVDRGLHAAPPLSEARVAGAFDVRIEITSQYGYSDYGAIRPSAGESHRRVTRAPAGSGSGIP